MEAVVSGPILVETRAALDTCLDQGFSLTVDPEDAQTLLFAYPSLAATLRWLRQTCRAIQVRSTQCVLASRGSRVFALR